MILWEDTTEAPEWAGYSVHPEWERELVELGFHRLGTLRTITPNSRALAAQFTEPDKSRAEQHLDAPAVVFIDSDRQAFAEIGPYWKTPSLRFFTVLKSGSLIATTRLFDRQVKRKTDVPWLAETTEESMRLGNGPTRSIHIVKADSPRAAWTQHQKQLQGLDSPPRRHEQMRQMMGLDLDRMRHGLATVALQRSAAILLWRAYMWGSMAAVLAVVWWRSALFGLFIGVALYMARAQAAKGCDIAGRAIRRSFPVPFSATPWDELPDAFFVGPEVPDSPSRLGALLKSWGPIGALLLFSFGKLKWLIAGIKFLKMGTLLTMLLSIWAYALFWGFKFAVGFVLLIFVHELGHWFVLRALGIRAGAPVFIPFVGAVITMKERPRDAYTEALVGIGGPALGSAGATFCLAIGMTTNEPYWYALASTGFLLNLFNMLPISPLDGGRIAGAISRWMWVVGYAIGIPLVLLTDSPILVLILLLGGFTMYDLWKNPVPGYYDTPWHRRLGMGTAYFGLIGLLIWGMAVAQDGIGDLTL